MFSQRVTASPLRSAAAPTAASRVRSSDPLDYDHLRRYTLGNAALEREILDLFLNQLPETIASLQNAASDNDWRMSTHTLKGSARAVGAWPLARAAEEAEKLQGVSATALCHDALQRIESAASDVRRFIASPSAGK